MEKIIRIQKVVKGLRKRNTEKRVLYMAGMAKTELRKLFLKVKYMKFEFSFLRRQSFLKTLSCFQ